MVYGKIADTQNCCLLAKKLESLLKDAKKQRLKCKEVLIPCDLMANITYDILQQSQDEPCGLRGCALFINLVENDACCHIGKLKCGDDNTVETFELHLDLKKEGTGWPTFLRKFLQKIGKDSTIVISPFFKISKRKLFRSWS